MSVLGPKKGVDLIERIPGTEVRIVREPGAKVEIFESEGFRNYYEDAIPPSEPLIPRGPLTK